MTERQWELYRCRVVKRMPESDYKTAVLAGIAHKLMMLDRMEASQSPSIEDAAGTGTDRSRGLALLHKRRAASETCQKFS